MVICRQLIARQQGCCQMDCCLKGSTCSRWPSSASAHSLKRASLRNSCLPRRSHQDPVGQEGSCPEWGRRSLHGSPGFGAIDLSTAIIRLVVEDFDRGARRPRCIVDRCEADPWVSDLQLLDSWTGSGLSFDRASCDARWSALTLQLPLSC